LMEAKGSDDVFAVSAGETEAVFWLEGPIGFGGKDVEVEMLVSSYSVHLSEDLVQEIGCGGKNLCKPAPTIASHPLGPLDATTSTTYSQFNRGLRSPKTLRGTSDTSDAAFSGSVSSS